MIATGVARWLTGLGVLDFNTVDGGDTFVNRLPSDPDVAVMVKDSPGVAGASTDMSDWLGLQVLVRDPNQERAMARAMQVYRLLHPGQRVTLDCGEIGIVEVVGTKTVSTPTNIGMDSSDRHLVTCNYLVRAVVR